MRMTGRRTKLAAPVAAAFLLLALSLGHPAGVRAQWTTSGTNTTTTNNVGVGTTAPGTQVEIRKDVSSDLGPIITLSNNLGGPNAGGALDFTIPGWNFPQARIRSMDNNDWSANIVFFTKIPGGSTNNIAERMRITSTGSVGIGTSAPSSLLHLYGAARPALTLSDAVAAAKARVFRTAATQSDFAHNISYDGTGWALDDTSAGGSSLSLGTNFIGINQWSAGTGYRTTTTPLYINSSGKVGIGTTSPAELLDVSGVGEVKARAVGTISAAIQLKESNGTATWSEWQQYFDRLRLNISDGTTTRPDVMSILPNGNVGIGKATPTEALDVVGNIKATGSVSATYQDVAEWVPSIQKLSAGTVVVLDADRTNHVLASATAYDTKVAGVVSDAPGVILGVAGDDKVKVATTGRVKVKVDASRAPIRVGDLLVTSETEGVAMKSVPVDLGGTLIHRPGTIIGKALEPLASGTGEILVLLSLQ